VSHVSNSIDIRHDVGRRWARALSYFVVVAVLAVAVAYLVVRITGGYGAPIAEGAVNAVGAYRLALVGPLRSTRLRALGWGAAGLVFSFVPVAWLSWRAASRA
jgi:hypothetical protein